MSTALHFLFQNLIQTDTKQHEATVWKHPSNQNSRNYRVEIKELIMIFSLRAAANSWTYKSTLSHSPLKQLFTKIAILTMSFTSMQISLFVKAKAKAETLRPNPSPLCTCHKNSQPRRPPQKEDLMMHMHRKSVKRRLILHCFCCVWFFQSRLASSQGTH